MYHMADRWRWRALAASCILASAGLHLAYFTYDCPLDLAPDEAHYWDWSRHLDWSYYSKGPVVAHLIRAGTTLAGACSRRSVESDMVAVRAPAVLCSSLLLAGLYVLTLQVYGRESLGAAVVALALTLPVVAAGASLMTIDAPYTCCWTWALVLGFHAACRRSAWAWPAAGLLVGLGILAKYTMVLWLPSFALFLASAGRRRRLLMRPGFWILCAVAGACCLPVVWWNARHGWIGFRHVGGQAGWDDGPPGLHWLGPIIYVMVQFFLLVGFWFIAWLGSLLAHRPGKETDAGILYLWWMSVPIFAFFGIFSVRTPGEPNWPVAAYLSGLVLTMAWVAKQIQAPQRWYRALARASLGIACALGLSVTLVMHHTEWVQPVVAWLSGPPTPARPLPLRRFDPTCRLRGWRTLAAAVDELRNQLRAEGVEADLAASGWTIPGEIAFYCTGRPTVYSLGLALGDRHSQYDCWHPNPLDEPANFRGHTFILVGDVSPGLHTVFETVETPRLVTHLQKGQPIACWTVTVCRNYHGFPLPLHAEVEKRF
jgi:hypothetical protein